MRKYNKLKVLAIFSIFTIGFICGKNLVNILNKHIEDIETSIITYNQEDKVYGMPYINPEWIEYNKLSEEEKAEVVNIPPKYIYDYVNQENLYGNYSDLPSRFTLRDEYPTNLYDQGSEGLCWAYSTASMIESNLKLTKGIDEKISRNQMAILTSREELGFYQERELTDGMPFKRNFAFSNFVLATGVVPAVDTSDSIEIDDDNYELENASNYNLEDLIYSSNNKYTITDSVSFPTYQNTEEYRDMMKSFIKKYGAIRIGTYWTRDDKFFDSSKNLMYKTNTSGSGHAIIIVGWDDNFETPNGNGAWIIQNSYSKRDGNMQYYFSYDLSAEGMFNIVGIKNIEEKTWNNHYTYLDYPEVSYEGIETKQEVSNFSINENEIDKTNDVIAITGTAKLTYTRDKAKKEKINMINIITASQGGSYTVLISPNGDENYRVVGEINTDLPGVYTIKPEDDIRLTGEKFTVKIITEDGAFYRYSNVFTNIEEESDEVSENSIITTQIGKSNNGNFLYRVVFYNNYSNDTDIEFGYSIGESNRGSYRSVKNYNGKAASLIEIPYYTEPGTDIKVTVRIQGVFQDTKYITHDPNGYLGDMEGEGTEINPYLVTTPEQLRLISEKPTAYYKLANDIDISQLDPADTMYLGWVSIDAFAGTLDGNGHKIKNLISASDNSTYGGLFKNLTNATIKNIIFENFESSQAKNVSALLANKAKNTIIENVSVLANFDERQTALIIEGREVVINGLYVNTFESKNQKNHKFHIFYRLLYEYDEENLEYRNFYNDVNNLAIITDYEVGIDAIKSLKNSYITGSYINLAPSIDIKENVYILGNRQNTDEITYFQDIETFKANSLSDLSFDPNVWVKNTETSLPTLKNANIDFINSINVADEISLNIGESKEINPIIQPIDAFNKNLVYSSSDTNIVEVDKNGTMTAISTGNATITIKTTDGSNVEKTINVTVGTDYQVVIKYKDYEETFAYPPGTTLTLPATDINNETILAWKFFKNSNEMYHPGDEFTVRSPFTLYAVYESNALSNSLYEYDNSKGIIKNICLVDVNKFIENLRLSNVFNAKVFVGDTEYTEGIVPSGSITKIYNGDVEVAQYTNIVPGDVYSDGYIGMKDAILIIRYKLDMIELNDEQVLSADFSRDGKVQLNDAKLIEKHVAGPRTFYEGVCPNEN